MKIIEVSGLHFSYQGLPVLCGVDFSVSPGDFVGVVGANGAGKSTLLKLIVGLLAPDQGKIRLFEQDIQTFRDFTRIAYVSQKTRWINSDFPANALETVLSGFCGKTGLFRPYGKARKEYAMHCLETVGMAARAKSQVGKMSAGQLQRVLLARALVNQPEALILDEPTVGIDAQAVEQVCCLLARLCRQNHTAIVMVTHDLPSVLSHASHFFFFYESGETRMTPNQGKASVDLYMNSLWPHQGARLE
ncbi:MAG: ABC transporter ATP-binding protein [Clostridiales bacterium]|jgi:zinc transport system ATP-binding protein|nr:ABC transporter ATP-binding protein [Clostridiales bacterium]MDR3239332.1 ABC transporter ATP-binding protein [Clostridiales bacterium]